MNTENQANELSFERERLRELYDLSCYWLHHFRQAPNEQAAFALSLLGESCRALQPEGLGAPALELLAAAIRGEAYQQTVLLQLDEEQLLGLITAVVGLGQIDPLSALEQNERLLQLFMALQHRVSALLAGQV